MKKKLLTVCLVVALCAIIITGASIAYFSDTDSKSNVFTVGNVEGKLTETEWDKIAKDNLGTPDEPIMGIKNVTPGKTYAKNPVVTNTGDNACYVRIKVTGLDCLKNADLSAKDIALAGLDTTNWTLKNGYYYYNTALAADSQTSALFTGITMPDDLANGGTANYTVTVTADIVQADGITKAGAAATVAEIEAWFTTCMPAA